MNRPTPPRVGSTDTRRPLPPHTYHFVPASELRTAPADIGQARSRLNVLSFFLPADRNPNGCPRPDRILADCGFRLGSDFHGRARVEKRSEGPGLAVATDAWDALMGHPVMMNYGMGLLRALYAELGRLYVGERAKRQSRGAGRN